MKILEAEGAAQAFGFLPPSDLAFTVASGEQGLSSTPLRVGAERKFIVQQDKFSDLCWEILALKFGDKNLSC